MSVHCSARGGLAGWVTCVLVALGLAGAPAPPAANSYYVAPGGDDAGPGSITRPWATLQHAADTLQPGDTVYARAGVYAESVSLTRSGLPGQPITFAGYPGETAVLDGGHARGYGWTTDSNLTVSDFAIRGFTVRNYTANGVAAWSVNDRVTLSDLVITGNGDFGILLSNGDGITVERVRLEGNAGGLSCSPIVPLEGPGCTHLVIRDSVAYDNGGGNNTGVDAFAVERGYDVLVERTRARGGPGDGFDFKAERVTLSQVIASNTRNNLKLWGRDSVIVNALAYDATADANLVLAAGGSYTITNVTVANMAGTAYLAVFGDPSGSGATPVTVRNTLFYNDNPAMEGTLLYVNATVQLDAASDLYYNPYRTDAVICADPAPYNGRCYSAADITAHVWPEPGALYADAVFTNPAAKDFHLGAGSPAVDSGSAAGAPAVDLDNRPRTGLPDRGAYEFWQPRAWLYTPIALR